MDELIKQIETEERKLKRLRSQLYLKERETIIPKVFNQEITDNWSMYQGDCVEVIKGIPDESIGYSIFSPPFLSLYVYSNSLQDMGNSKNDNEFYSHFSYLMPELFRVLKTGRLVSIHCSIIHKTLTHDNSMGLKDLPGMIVQLMENFGFEYHSKVVIWKSALLQATRTKTLSLAHKQISKDSSRCGQGFADEILTFVKPGENKEPIAHGRGFENYIGDLPEPKIPKNDNPKLNKYSHEVWQRYASPIWMDINQSDTLNARSARDNADERHICPLQLQVIARCLELWTNPGDIVLSPFAGIGSEGFESLKMERKFIGIELKESYYKNAIKNLKTAKNRQKGIL
jgi:DNA modification methylase